MEYHCLTLGTGQSAPLRYRIGETQLSCDCGCRVVGIQLHPYPEQFTDTPGLGLAAALGVRGIAIDDFGHVAYAMAVDKADAA